MKTHFLKYLEFYLFFLGGLSFLGCSPKIRHPLNKTPDPTCVSASGFFSISQISQNKICNSSKMDLYLAVQNDTTSYIALLSYNSETNLVEFKNSSLLPDIYQNFVRGFTFLNTTTLLSGDGSGLSADSTLDTLGSPNYFNIQPGSPNALTSVHGLCSLPNGHIIVGEYDNNYEVQEYDQTGDFLREVYSGATPLESMSECYALSNTEIILNMADADSENFSSVVKMSFDGTSWSSETNGIWNSTDFDTANTTSNTSVWTMAYHDNGSIYLPPFIRTQTGANPPSQKMIECGIANLSGSGCQEIGQPLMVPDAAAMIYSLQQIPFTEDLLLSTDSGLYRYGLANGATSLLANYASLLPGTDNLVRHIVIKTLY